MWFYIKKAFFSFIYLIFMFIIATSIFLLDENLTWLRFVLLLVNLALYLFIVCASAFKEGQDALKIRTANDLERKEIIRTGEDRPLKLKEEYKPFKGAIIGLFICLPLFILLIVHTILIITVGESCTGAGAVAGLIYMVTFGFVKVFITTVTAYQYYFTLIFPLIVIPAYGIAYYLGGRKLELQQQRIKEKQREIYGDNK